MQIWGGGNPLDQATKQHLNHSQTVKKIIKNEMESSTTY